MADKIINITNIGSLISYIKAKCVAWFWPKDDVQDIDLATVATTGSYNDLLDKPTAATGAIIYLGTCPTAAATATKVVTTTAFPTQNGAPVVGIVIGVKFSNTSTATEPKLNVNGLGAAGIYYNAAVATSTSAVYGGTKNRYTYYMWDGTYWCWLSQGIDANDNTIGYQIRTSGQRLPVATACYRYRLLFTSADGTKLVPANSSTSTNATASRTPATAKIDPFGQILYYSYTTALSANGQPSASYQHQQYAGISIGYSFNNTGAAATMTYPAPIYIKCAPQTDGSAIIDSTTPYVQALPSTADGKIYIFLGIATSATAFELLLNHPVYHFADGQIRLWTNAAASVTVDQTYDATSANAQSGVAMAGALAGKQDTISDLVAIRQGSENNVKYVEQSLTDAQKAQARDNAGAQGLHEGATSGVTNPKEGDICVEPNWQSISPTYTGASTASFTYRVYDVHSYTGSLRITAFSEYGWWIDRGSTAHLLDDTPIIIPAGEAASIRIEASLGETPSLTIEEQQGITNNKEYYNGAWRDRAYELSTNKVTSISSSSTDTQYPSAKAVAGYVGGITGDLADLQTTDKSDLVAAINEAASSGGTNPLPTGGSAGQVLAKASAADYDVEWGNIPSSGGGALPAGGTKGQTLVKQSAIDGDATWVLRDENKELIIDQTFHFDNLQPTAYDSVTGYYTVDSFPSWVTAGDGGTFRACLNVVAFSSISAVPYPRDNASSICDLTRVDSTHFSIASGQAPSGTPNPAAFFFTPTFNGGITIPRVLNAKTKYRMVVENGASYPCYYNPVGITTRQQHDLFTSFPMPRSISSDMYGPRILQSNWEIEFTLDTTTSTTYMIAHSIRRSAVVRTKASGNPLFYEPLTVGYGDNKNNSWQVGNSGDFYLASNYASIEWLHEGTRVRVYKIG